MNQGEILDDLLHLLKLKQRGEAALTCRGIKALRSNTGGEISHEGVKDCVTMS